MKLTTLSLFGSLLCINLLFAGRWDYGFKDPHPASLPKLSQELVLDGKLKEWTFISPIKIDKRDFITWENTPNQWQGKEDSSVKIYCAWTQEGLCIGVDVIDDKVYNEKKGKNLWKQDCVELFFDGRHGDNFMKRTYSKGAFQILVRPEMPNQPCSYSIMQDSIHNKNIKIKGYYHDKGHSFELLVPWNMFPKSKKKGDKIALQFAIDDFDKSQNGKDEYLQMSWHGTKGLSSHPEKFIPWVLTESIKQEQNLFLKNTVNIDLLRENDLDSKVDIIIRCKDQLIQHLEHCELTIMDWTQVNLVKKKMIFKKDKSSSYYAKYKWNLRGRKDGIYYVQTIFRNQYGYIVGKNHNYFIHKENMFLGEVKHHPKIETVDLNPKDPSLTTIGKLRYMGGISIDLHHPALRSQSSGLYVASNGIDLTSVGRGFWLQGKLEYDKNGYLTHLKQITTTPILGKDGTPLKDRKFRDAECLGWDGKKFIVGFEKRYRVWGYENPSSKAIPLMDMVESEKNIPKSGGYSSLTVLPSGKVLALTESSVYKKNYTRGWIMGTPPNGIFYIERKHGLPIGLGTLPNQNAVLIEISRSRGRYNKMAISEVLIKNLKPGVILKTNLLGTVQPPMSTGCFQGISANQESNGKTYIYTLTDNFGTNTLILLKFELMN